MVSIVQCGNIIDKIQRTKKLRWNIMFSAEIIRSFGKCKTITMLRVLKYYLIAGYIITHLSINNTTQIEILHCFIFVLFCK